VLGEPLERGKRHISARHQPNDGTSEQVATTNEIRESNLNKNRRTKMLQTNDFTEQLTAKFECLKQAEDNYRADIAEGLTGKQLRALNTKVATLQAELSAAEQELAKFKSLGSPVDKFES
jgi:hypothetical protein